MKKYMISCIVLLLIGCAKETTNSPPIEQPIETTVSSEVGAETIEATEEDDIVTENPLEATNALITATLEEMDEWNSIEMYTSYKEIYEEGSENEFEFIRFTQYIRNPSTVYIDEQFTSTHHNDTQYYADEYGNAYMNIGDGYMEADNTQIGRDHIQSRIDFLTFAYANGENHVAELDGNEAVETFTISPTVYEAFSDKLHPILSIFVDDLDNIFNYELVEVQILLEGITIKGYRVSLTYQLDEINSLKEAVLMESFETVDELQTIDTPFAG